MNVQYLTGSRYSFIFYSEWNIIFIRTLELPVIMNRCIFVRAENESLISTYGGSWLLLSTEKATECECTCLEGRHGNLMATVRSSTHWEMERRRSGGPNQLNPTQRTFKQCIVLLLIQTKIIVV